MILMNKPVFGVTFGYNYPQTTDRFPETKVMNARHQLLETTLLQNVAQGFYDGTCRDSLDRGVCGRIIPYDKSESKDMLEWFDKTLILFQTLHDKFSKNTDLKKTLGYFLVWCWDQNLEYYEELMDFFFPAPIHRYATRDGKDAWPWAKAHDVLWQAIQEKVKRF